MYNVGTVRFRLHSDEYGKLTPIESGIDIPFPIKRVYYIYDVPTGMPRGFHSHKTLHQVLVALGGSVKIRLKTSSDEQITELNNPAEGLYIGPHVWREMFDFSPSSTLLVLASELYDENDYIRDFYTYVNENPLERVPE